MLRSGHVIAVATLCLLCLGAVMVASSEMSVRSDAAVTFQSVATSVPAQHMLVALACMTVCALLPIDRLLPVSRLGAPWGFPMHRLSILATLALVGAMLLVYVPGIGRVANGSHRWINVPVFGSAQPSEFAKWGLVLLLAVHLAWQGARIRSFWRLMVSLVPIGLLAGLVIIEDLGTGVLMLAVAGTMLLASGARIWHLLLFVPPALAGLGFALITSPYRVTRLLTFLDPYADPQGTGYHMIQSMVTVAGGEGFGRGLGFGLQKFGYLPEQRTDFLFAVICEELGIVGAALVLSLYIAILWSGLSIMKRLPRATPEGAAARLLALGVLMTICIQAAINVAVVTGVAPTKGIALPLLSAGGTGWILTASCLGLLIALDRRMAFDTTEPVLFTAEDDRTLSLGERVAATEGKRPGEGGADRAAASINDAPLITIRRADHVKRRAAS
jgi:cell division protein FtsW